MESSRTMSVVEAHLLDDTTPVSSLSLVEIAGRLEKITSAIEVERAKERTARKVYKVVVEEVEAEVERIRVYARTLVIEQRRRMSSFDGMLSRQQGGATGGTGGTGGTGAADVRELKPSEPRDAEVYNGRFDDDETEGGSHGRLNISDAILKIWTLSKYKQPLTTEEITRALVEVGYTTKAVPRSIKSTLNQALAKLCRDRKVRRFRTDGEEIDATDAHSRARKYMAV